MKKFIIYLYKKYVGETPHAELDRLRAKVGPDYQAREAELEKNYKHQIEQLTQAWNDFKRYKQGWMDGANARRGVE